MRGRERERTVQSSAQPSEFTALLATPRRRATLFGVGRPTYYREPYPKVARLLCLEGYTDADIAEALRVGAATLCDWKLRYPEFALALRQGRGLPEPPVSPGFPKAETSTDPTPERDLRLEPDLAEVSSEPSESPTQRGVCHLERVTDPREIERLRVRRLPTTALM